MQNWRVSYPNFGCLHRVFANGRSTGAFYPTVVLESIRDQSVNYESYRQAIEAGPHGSVHVQIGGDMNTMFSPNE